MFKIGSQKAGRNIINIGSEIKVGIEDIAEVLGKCSICEEDATNWLALTDEYRCDKHVNTKKGGE